MRHAEEMRLVISWQVGGRHGRGHRARLAEEMRIMKKQWLYVNWHSVGRGAGGETRRMSGFFNQGGSKAGLKRRPGSHKCGMALRWNADGLAASSHTCGRFARISAEPRSWPPARIGSREPRSWPKARISEILARGQDGSIYIYWIYILVHLVPKFSRVLSAAWELKFRTKKKWHRDVHLVPKFTISRKTNLFFGHQIIQNSEKPWVR